jgi:hypothetical protein
MFSSRLPRPEGEGPDPGCDDVLGIISMEDTYVADTVANGTDCEIHGVIMSLWRLFQVENWNAAPPRGTLTVWGGIIADQAWRVGTYDGADICRSGYYRNWHYDGRMRNSLFPPYFPETGRYIMTFWEEVVPPVV